MIKYQNLIFDLDGTLWDMTQVSLKGMNQGLNDLKAGFNIDLQKIRSVTGKPVDECGRLLFPGLSNEAIETVYQKEDDFLETEPLGLYFKVEETLKALKNQGIELYLISNCSTGYLHNFFDRSGLKPLFTDWDCYGSALVPKGEMIQNMVEIHKIKDSVAYIGDTQTDYEACQFAGCDMIWATYGFGQNLPVNRQLQTFSDILNYV